MVVTLELAQLKSYGVGSKCYDVRSENLNLTLSFHPPSSPVLTPSSCLYLASSDAFIRRFYQTLCEAVSERLWKQQLEIGRKKGVLSIFQERPQTVHSGNRNNFLVHRVPPS